jgi:hypothetical protein
MSEISKKALNQRFQESTENWELRPFRAGPAAGNL